MKKLFIALVALVLLAVPSFVKADRTNSNNVFNEKDAVVVAEETKYIKTVTKYTNVVRDSYGNISSADVVSSISYDITEEEYNNADLEHAIVNSRDLSTSVETTYKLMTTSILYSNGTYRYKNILNWLNFPSVRNYDIIGIGHYGNVTVSGTPYFLMEYVTLSGLYQTGYYHSNQNFTYGSSSTFHLPLENLSSLKITYYYDVQKTNANSTITSQGAFGDYSHSTTTSLGLTDVTNHHTVNQYPGIVLDSSIYYSFDTMNEAEVYWYGTW